MDGRRIYDITPLVSHRIAVFPGDTAYEEQFLLDMKNDDNLTLSFIKTTVHLGAHTDAPNHYQKEGLGMSERSLEFYLGKCQIIEVNVGRGVRVRPADLAGVAITAPRVLLKTETYPEPDQWNSDFASLSKELIDHLASQKVILVGIDTPSIDPCDDKKLESHSAVARHDMAILEGIVLKDVEPGIYDLIALPLKLEGADASPVRAVLVR